jgi:hypothetical protein
VARSKPYLGPGEFGLIPTTTARESRRKFLLAASKHEQIRLLDSLYSEVFNKFPEGPDEFTKLVQMWAAKRNLDYPWVRDEALEVYFRWLPVPPGKAPPWPLPPTPKQAGFEDLSTTYRFPPFHIPPWLPTEEPDVYKRRVVRKFEKYLGGVIRQCKISRKPLQQRRPRPGHYHQTDHYRWAVERVCLKRGWTEIANENQLGINTQGIREAVLKVLKCVGIPGSTS